MKHDHRVAYLEPSLTPSNESQNAETSADPLVDSVVSDIETKESSDDILGLSVSPEVLDSKSEDASQHVHVSLCAGAARPLIVKRGAIQTSASMRVSTLLGRLAVADTLQTLFLSTSSAKILLR